MKTYEKYLIEKTEDDKYVCAKNGNNPGRCFWSGNKPVKQKSGKLTCPVCGGDAVKNWEYKGKKK